MTDETHHVNESADKIVVKTKIKRGTNTRDEDKLDIKVKGEDPETVVEKLDATLEHLSETADDVRALQPGEDDDE